MKKWKWGVKKMRNHYYDRPNPHSIMDTVRMERAIKEDKEKFKKEELEQELKHEDRIQNRINNNNS